MNVYILNNVIHEANKKREYLKERIKESARNINNKHIRDLYRGLDEFKRDYQSRSNLVKEGNGDLLANYEKNVK
jgi:hypothetical protein